MSRFCVGLLMCACNAMLAGAPVWLWEKEGLALEKEQIYRANIQVGAVEKELQFRWTLYKNFGLVLHIRYDKFNHQALLYTDYQRNAFSFSLGRGLDMQREGEKEKPIFYMYFKAFNDKKAVFNLYIQGQGAMVLNEEIEPVKKRVADSAESSQSTESSQSSDSQNPANAQEQGNG